MSRSDDPTPDRDPRPGLEEYFESYAPKRFPTAKKRRTKQLVAQRFKLPLIRVGNTVLVDPEMADDQLRKFAKFQPEPAEPLQLKRRGRPRAALRRAPAHTE